MSENNTKNGQSSDQFKVYQLFLYHFASLVIRVEVELRRIIPAP